MLMLINKCPHIFVICAHIILPFCIEKVLLLGWGHVSFTLVMLTVPGIVLHSDASKVERIEMGAC